MSGNYTTSELGAAALQERAFDLLRRDREDLEAAQEAAQRAKEEERYQAHLAKEAAQAEVARLEQTRRTARMTAGERSVQFRSLDAWLPSPLKEAVIRQRSSEMARELLAAEHAQAVEIPDGDTLAALIAADDEEDVFAIEGLLHEGGNVLFSAQKKAGKTSTVFNLARSLVDAEPFLDHFAVSRRRRVAILDLEMSTNAARAWLRGLDIRHPSDIVRFPLRGAGASFRITDDGIRARWADLLKGFEVLILDPVRPLMDALGLDEHKEAGVILGAFDALKREAGITEGIVVHHQGHAGTHARGDSRFEDWPDAIWKIQRQDTNDPRSFRFFEAYGRDVDVPRGLLSMYDGRRLAFAPETTTSMTERRLSDVLDSLRARGPMTADEIGSLGIAGVSKNSVRGVLATALGGGSAVVEQEGRKKLYKVVDARQLSPGNYSPHDPSESPS